MLPATCQAKIREAWEQLDDSHVQEAEIQSKQLGPWTQDSRQMILFKIPILYCSYMLSSGLRLFSSFFGSSMSQDIISLKQANPMRTEKKKIYVSCILILEPVLVFISHIWMIRVTLNQSLWTRKNNVMLTIKVWVTSLPHGGGGL